MKKAAVRDEIYKNAELLAGELSSRGYKAYFAGGYVRDLLIGRKIKDIDIATDALPDDIEKIFPDTFATGKSFGVMNVIQGGYKFEIATFRQERSYSDGRRPDEVMFTDDPKIDSERRDFTINAMFYSPLTEEILDFHQGICDLRKGILRAVGNPCERFNEDHLRIMRAVRFAAEYGLEIEENTKKAIIESAPLLSKISAERLREELEKMLLGFNPRRAFEMMMNTGVLDVVLPELSSMRGALQDEDYHPEGDVMEHTLLMLSHLTVRTNVLAWSVLLHDCGKPRAFSLGDDGRKRFYGHEEIGREMAEGILRRLKSSLKLIDNVSYHVGEHMKFAHAQNMRKAKLSRVLCSEFFSDALELHRIDCISSHKKMDVFAFLLDKFSELNENAKIPEPLVRGADLIAEGFKPGPAFSKILNELHNRQLENPQLTKADLLMMLKDFKD